MWIHYLEDLFPDVPEIGIVESGAGEKKSIFDTQKDGNILTTIELGLINGSNYLRLFGHTE